MTTADVPGGDAGRDLYALVPDGFTAARNALARRLRTSGDRAGAALVAKLRRPPVSAWALNMLARERPEVVDAVYGAGAALRAATEEALAGDASALRTAQVDERRAVDAATTAAAGFLTEAGLGAGDGPRQRMAGTLRAAMVDETVAAALRDGVLDDDRDAAGFGLDAFSAAAGTATRRRAPSRAAPGAAGTKRSPQPIEGPTSGNDHAAPSADQAAAAAEAAAAERRTAEAEEAERHAVRLRKAADEAERAAGSARDRATAARAEAADAAARAEDAAAASAAATTSAAAARSTADDASAHADEIRKAATSAG